MHMFRSARWLMLTLLLSLIPASMHGQVVISVGFAPPELPVYEQPVCPEPNLIWSPGYWAYDQDQGDYYWVPGAWVPVPYDGALWTPPYWGWYGGHYRFHRGYWGRHVGYYGGVNYGYGYGGIGYAGGEWQGNNFRYNTAVTRVNESTIHSTYNDRAIVERNTVANNNRVAYSGGPGGIQHTATAQENVAARDKHTAPTSVQTQHAASARTEKTSFAKANGGHPQNAVVAKPLGPVKASQAPVKTEARTTAKAQPKTEARTPAKAQPKTEAKTPAKAQPKTEARTPAKAQPKTESRPAPQQQARPAPQQQSRPAPQQQSRPAPQQQSRPAPQQQSRPAPQQQSRPAPQQARPAPQQQSRPAPQQQARPAPQQQSHPAPQQQHAAPEGKPR